MNRKKIQQFYEHLLNTCEDLLLEEENVDVNSLLGISSTLICFTVDFLRKSSTFTDEEIQSLIIEALDLSLTSKEDLEKIEKEELEKEEHLKGLEENLFSLKTNKKMLN